MPNDSVLSWILLTILVYGVMFYAIANGAIEKERYERGNNDLF